MIEEKNIKRLSEHDEVLKRGFNLILIKNSAGTIIERIKHNKEEFVAEASTRNYMNRDSFDTYSLLVTEEIPWFDTQKPKMRKMTLVEIHNYLIEEKKLLCYEYHDGELAICANFLNSEIKNNYENYGTLNSDGTFKPLHLVEDK